MGIITLAQAVDSAATAVHMDREKSDRQFGPGLFDAALAHHAARDLRADTTAGKTRDRDGERARFVGYDWADSYRQAPHFVWFDFFRGDILNSVSRASRGLPM